MILRVSSRSKSICVSTSTRPSNSVGRDKNSLLSDDLLRMIYDIMFGNPFAYQHIFDYFEPSNNEDDVNDDDGVIHNVHELKDVSMSSFVVSYD